MRAGNLIFIVQLSSLISLGWFEIKTLGYHLSK
jgi:hypothetical protein